MSSNNAAELGRINGNIVNINNANVVTHGKSTRTPQPRTLNKKESLDSITQWKTTLSNHKIS